MIKRQLKADPFKDLEIIDVRAPRFNQAVVAISVAIAIFFELPWIFLVLAMTFFMGLVFGRKYCPQCYFYFKVIQPIIGEGELEDSRPPRLANQMAFGFLLAAGLSSYAGLEGVGYVLAGMVFVLAVLASTTGFCVGCEIYKLSVKLRGKKQVKEHQLNIKPVIELLNDNQKQSSMIIQFLHPLCAGCLKKERELRNVYGDKFVAVDISKNKKISKEVGISYVPVIIEMDSNQVVTSLSIG